MFPYRRLPSHITGLYIFTVINFLLLCHMTLVQADISVISLETNETVVPFIADLPAYFGGHISYDGVWGQTVYADPATACQEIKPPPKNSTIQIPGVQWFVLIMRSGCPFSKKVLNAQSAGYDVAIIHNVGSNQLEPMGPDKEKGILIPSVFIGETDGLNIQRYFTYEKKYILQISPDLPFSLNPYILPFAVGVGACLFVMMLVMIVKCVRDRNRRRRVRLPARLLEKLPIQKFKKNDPYDTCAICLEEYVEGEKLRVLPCNHTYHTKCIDPWLTENRRTCPVCKRKVFSRDRSERRNLLSSVSATESDSDSDSDNGRANESTPLIPPGTHGNINAREQDVGRTNQGVLWDDSESEAEENSPDHPVASSSRTNGSLSGTTTNGGRYQSLVSASGSCSNGSCSNGMRLSVPIKDLLSSGEHSVNGDLIDFVPVNEPLRLEGDNNQSLGPVEIAIDVAARETEDFSQPSSSHRNSISSRGKCDMLV